MKITVKQYAKGLLAAIDGKSEKEATLIVASLLKVMITNKDLKNIDLVVDNFEKYWNKKNDLSVVELTTARETSSENKKKISDYVATMLGVGQVEMNEKIDKDILGGIIIQEGDRIFDGSLKTRLYDLKEKIVK